MINKNFYPTPKKLIEKMADKLKCGSWSKIQGRFLEPSAGKGDIAIYLKEKISLNSGSVDCIEIDEELQNFLLSKDLSVIHNDFLTFKSYYSYDYIIMNPPFDNGVKHLLKAIELGAKTSCKIVCILNAETIKNPYTNERKHLIRLLEEYKADIEYIKEAFKNAERKSDVEIALITIDISRKSIDNNEFLEKIEFESKQEIEEEVKSIGNYEIDFLREDYENLVIDYNTEMKLLKHLIDSYHLYVDFINTREYFEFEFGQKYKYQKRILEVRKYYWEKILNTAFFEKYMIGDVQNQILEVLGKQSKVEFTLKNIEKLQQHLIQFFIQNIENSSITLFKKLTNHHQSEFSKNIHYYNGWKTNKSYKLNKKIILPAYANKGDIINDLEKVLNYFDGFNNNNMRKNPARSCNLFNDQIEHSSYLEITIYKKGTCHIKIKRLDLLDRYNLYIGRIMAWLPSKENKKEYEKTKKEIFNHYDHKEEIEEKIIIPKNLLQLDFNKKKEN